jgi:hypothetical protein
VTVGVWHRPLATLIGVAATGAVLAISWPAQAELWSGFYGSSAPQRETTRSAPRHQGPSGPRAAIEDSTVCIAEILEAQSRYGIPDNLLLAIGIQEAGRYGDRGLTVWPWAVNAEGKGAFFATQGDLLAWVKGKQAQGMQSIDVGCMQVNQLWHGRGFASLEEAVTPRANVDYAARYLLGLYREEGDWWQAAGRYHSSTQKFKDIYLGHLARNHKVANANLDRFLTLLDWQGDVPTVETTLTTAAAAPKPTVFWGTGLTTESDEVRSESFSIYSTQPIRPYLPDYQENF